MVATKEDKLAHDTSMYSTMEDVVVVVVMVRLSPCHSTMFQKVERSVLKYCVICMGAKDCDGMGLC
jgi:hypothetical protein